MILVESVVCSVGDAIAAARRGAGRLELCSAIELGGLTPSIGVLRGVLQSVDIPVMVMVRPRCGGFVYSGTELDAMEADIHAFVEAGGQGVVFGVLTSTGEIDGAVNRRLLKAAGSVETIFHRAIDITPDPVRAVRQLIELGFKRVLTSGGAADALTGAPMLAKMIEAADDRIEILPGGGIRHNVQEFLRQVRTNQIHLGPFRRTGEFHGQFGEGHLVLDEEALAAVIKLSQVCTDQPNTITPNS